MTKPRGSLVLKVIGVLMLLFGFYSVFTGFTFMNTTEEAIREALNVKETIDMEAVRNFGYVTLGLGAFMSVAGLFGCMYSAKPERANVLLVFGTLYLLLAVFSIVMQMISNMKIEVSTFTPLILPIIYVYAAFINKKS